MKQITYYSIILLIISLMSCGQETQVNIDNETPDGWSIIDKTDYTIQYPDSFDLNTSGQMGTKFILLSKRTSEQDVFMENINMLVQDLTGRDIDLDKFVEITEDQVRTMLTNGDIIESERIITDGSEFHKVIYTGFNGQYDLKFEQYFFVVKDKVYILTLTCEIDQFSNYKEVGEKILNSFRIK